MVENGPIVKGLVAKNVPRPFAGRGCHGLPLSDSGGRVVPAWCVGDVGRVWPVWPVRPVWP